MGPSLHERRSAISMEAFMPQHPDTTPVSAPNSPFQVGGEGTESALPVAKHGTVEDAKRVPPEQWGSDKNSSEQGPSHLAAESGNTQVFEDLVKINQIHYRKDCIGRTPLHLAAGKGQLEMIKYISTVMPDVLSDKDNDGWTAAHYAATYRHVPILEFLKGVVSGLLSVTDNKGRTPAHHAAASGHVDVLEFLNG